MEESLKYLKEQFQLKKVDIRTYSPLTLAYIGDGAYELVIRTILVEQGNCPVNKLHQRASSMVKAAAQAAMLPAIEECLTEEEANVLRRGKNAKPASVAKNASLSDYRRATGFEALMGYLYLKGDLKRMIDLIKTGLEGKGDTK